MTDFAGLLAALADGDVAFIIVGGLAATVHRFSRLTQDIGVVYARDDVNLEHLVAALDPIARTWEALHLGCRSNGQP